MATANAPSYMVCFLCCFNCTRVLGGTFEKLKLSGGHTFLFIYKFINNLKNNHMDFSLLKKRIAAGVLAGTLVFSFGGCKLTVEQCETIEKADMIAKALTLMAPSVYTGSAFALTTVIKNVAAESCETAYANQSSTSLEVEYRADESASWQNTGFTVDGGSQNVIYAPTKSLNADQETGFEDEFVFADPGQYRFVGMSDAKVDVDERDEYNNNNNTDGNVNSKKVAGYVTVLPAADYVPSARVKSGKLPVVKHVSHKVLY